jgi:hypothetical protein
MAPTKRKTKYVRKPPPTDALAYRVDEAAAIIRCSRAHMWQLIKTGRIRPVRYNFEGTERTGRTVIERTELERFLKQQREAA